MRLVIADDHGVVRGGLRLLLDRQPDMEVVGEAADGAEAVAQTLAHRPDIAILDVAMPRLTGLQTSLTIPAVGLEDLDADEQIVVYRIVQEGLSNVARHAAARSVRVEVERPSGGTVVRLADDGTGFTPSAAATGLGIKGMRERAVLAGGRFYVDSAPGHGTTIELRLGVAA